MRLVNLDEKNNDRYKVILSKEDRKKLILGIVIKIMLVIIIFLNIILITIVFLLSLTFLSNKLYLWLNSFFNSLPVGFYSLTILFFTVLPGVLWYFTSFESFFKPFDFRGVVIDVVDKKILLKNKSFSFKDTDSLVFSLEKKREKNTAPLKNNKKKNEGKDKSASNWVYYVKKKAFPEPNSEELDTNALFANNSEEYIIPPAEIKTKYLEDFSLVLGKDGVLEVWRRIAELLGICFEENIEFEEEILLQPSNDAFPPKTSNDFSLNQESSSLSIEIEEDETKMREVLVFLRKKAKRNTSSDTFLGLPGFGEQMLLDKELMGVRMLSDGFELRFWNAYSVFPNIKITRVFDEILDANVVILSAALMVSFTSMFMLIIASSYNDMLAEIGKCLLILLFILYPISYDLKTVFKYMRSKVFLFRVTYFFEHFSLFTGGILILVLGFFAKSSLPKIGLLSLGLIIVFTEFSFFLIPLQRSSCPWDLNINRYTSRLVFSFEDQLVEGEHGLCVSRTHWRAPISKIQSLAVLGEKYSFGACKFLLAIRIEEDYVLMPLPCFRGDKIRKILSFLQEIFNMLLTAFYSANNTNTTK